MVEHIPEMSVIRGTLSSMENRTLTVSSGVPAFLAKLWKLVEDPSSDHLISWSPVSVRRRRSVSSKMASWFCVTICSRHARKISQLQLANPAHFCVLFCRMRWALSFTIKWLFPGIFCRSISSTTILQASFVNLICVSQYTNYKVSRCNFIDRALLY